MSGPTIQATITANDKASEKLRHIADLARRIAKELDASGKQPHLATSFDAASMAAKRHVTHLHAIRDALKSMAAAGAAYAALKFPHMAADAIRHYLPLDKQLATMRAVGGFDEASMKLMVDQQRKLARVYGQSPEDVAHGQNELVKRRFDAATIQAFIDKSGALAQALGTDIRRATTALEGAIFGFGEHVKTAADAVRLGQRYSDISAVMAKRGAMSIEDIEGFFKYGAGAANSAHLTPEQSAALAMTLKRENYIGQEAGVFVRQLGARLMMPTSEGKMALAAAGIDLNQYTTAGKRDVGGLNLSLGENIGKEIGAGALKALQSKVDSGAISTARDFGLAVVTAFQAENGKQKAKDARAIAKQASSFWDVSKGAVDGSGLWDAIVSKMTPQEAMAFLGVKQGSKQASIISQLPTLREYESDLRGNSGITQKIAGEQQTSLSAAFDRLKATVEDTSNSFVTANEGVLKLGAGYAQTVAKMFGDVDGGTKRALTVGGAGAAVAGGAWGVGTLFAQIKSGFGLNASAASLTASAAALESAAVKLGGGSLAKDAAQGGAQGAIAGAAKKSPWGALGEMALLYSGWQFYKEKTADWFGWTDEKRKEWDAKINAKAWAAIQPHVPNVSRPNVDLRNNLPAYDEAALARARGARESVLAASAPTLESFRAAARSGAKEGSLSALFSGRDNILSQPFAAGGKAKEVQVGVQGNVQGQVDIHNTLRVDPSPLFLTKMSAAEHAVARVEGSIVKLGRTMSSGGNAPRASSIGGSVLAPTPAPLKL